MIRVEDIFKQNQEESSTIFIHLQKARQDEYAPLMENNLWDGWLRDIPNEYMECAATIIGQSLTDLEKGITGFYIEIF